MAIAAEPEVAVPEPEVTVTEPEVAEPEDDATMNETLALCSEDEILRDRGCRTRTASLELPPAPIFMQIDEWICAQDYKTTRVSLIRSNAYRIPVRLAL